MKTLNLLLTFFILAPAVTAQWEKQAVNTTASLRGLSVVNDRTVWASGTGGTFLKTTDGGKTWKVGAVPGAEKLDFRDIEAFDAKTAYVLSIGNGENSRIYKTIDGGETWRLQFTNKIEKAFFDAIACWDKNNCIAMSDPVGGFYHLIFTRNGGKTWTPIGEDKIPPAIEGEAAFAASGTCLIVNGKSDAYLVSGGKAARVFRSTNRGLSWFVADTPIVKGTDGSGIFSIAMRDRLNGVIVGGNYEKPNETGNSLAFTTDGGKTWKLGAGLTGYRSGVAFVDKNTLIAVGSNGSDLSADGGKTWRNLDKESYNAVHAKSKTAIWVVGDKGMVAKLSGADLSAAALNLQDRVLLYYESFRTANYGLMWDLSSKKHHAGNDNNRAGFVKYVQKHGFARAKIKTDLVSLMVIGRKGKIKVDMKMWLESEKRWVVSTEENSWIFENGNWFYDGPILSTVKEDNTALADPRILY